MECFDQPPWSDFPEVVAQAADIRRRMPVDSNIVFTHGDINQNLLIDVKDDGPKDVQITALVDWEQAGWRPAYWEKLKIRYQSGVGPQWKRWREMIEGYDQDLGRETEMALRARHSPDDCFNTVGTHSGAPSMPFFSLPPNSTFDFASFQMSPRLSPPSSCELDVFLYSRVVVELESKRTVETDKQNYPALCKRKANLKISRFHSAITTEFPSGGRASCIGKHAI
ncbi:hypothetical protein BT96DRAFT_1025163 [Gymnopus androsaceus JB14]|uniref:Aminoglycoside phosphotransferase domain-containing protein n=1 Tax=Gymnopus androsaceus JB14 TaxID=1447944 RepID=A0A6A4GTQ9_9AGAR|nr:hypothetical protein BT96DRAFT_1025163 [Gymnopus androsaceus JB14]